MVLFSFSSTASGEGADTAKECFSHEMALVLASVLLGEDWQPQQHLKQVGIHLSNSFVSPPSPSLPWKYLLWVLSICSPGAR